MGPAPPSQFHELPERVYAVQLDGELYGPELHGFELNVDAAIARGELAIVVDLRDVSFVASAVINAMFRQCRKLRQVGGALAIVCTDPQALRVIQVTGLDKAVAVCSDPDEAVRIVSPHRDGFR